MDKLEFKTHLSPLCFKRHHEENKRPVPEWEKILANHISSE